MIEFQNISKSYKTQKVVHDINLTINDGEFVVFIGASGSGKTTLLKMINRLIKPSSGKILINGNNVMEMDVIKMRRKMGYVIQQTGLFPHMTIRENIEIIEKLEKRDHGEIVEKTQTLMEMVGLSDDDYLDRYPTQLSGGQQQRVGVARALAIDPDIILMDEPFSALDPVTKGQLQDELLQLQSELKKTIVFVTHDMDEAIKLADRICILNDGQIAQFDTPEMILKTPADDFVSDFVGRERIWTAPELIRAEDIMIKSPVTAQPSTTVFRCMERMRSHKVDSVLVVDKQAHLLGAAYSSTFRKVKERSLPVTDVMETELETVKRGDSIIEILQMINENRISNIPVVDDAGKLCGLITKSSLVTTLSQQYLDTEEVM